MGVEDSNPLLRHLRFAGERSRRVVGPPLVRRESPASEEDGPTEPFIAWLMEQAAMDASQYRVRPLLRRMPACLRALNCHDASEARGRIIRHPRLVSVALSSLLLGVTEFFRDGTVFERLGEAIAERAEKESGPVRVLCAACADGAEAYSVAILLAERGLLDGALVHGIDCRADAVQSARAGRYGEGSLKRMPPSWRERYFEADGSRFRVVDALRPHVRFEVRDLCRAEALGEWDIILWRNSAMYLKAATATALWRRLSAALKGGGLLVAGKAERPPGDLGLKRIGPCVYEKEV